MMQINVEITKNPGESPVSVLRRFTKRVQSSSTLVKARSRRYSERKQSHYKIKNKTLNYLARKAETQKLIKLGKIADRSKFSK